MVVPFEYDIVGDCSDSRIRVYNGEYTEADSGSRFQNGGAGKAGFINSDGSMTIDPTYDAAQDFCCGRAFVKSGDKWGCIDATGALVIPYEYDYVAPFQEDFALVFSGSTNQFGAPMSGTYSYIDLSGKMGFIDPTGNLVIDAQWDDAGSFHFTTGSLG